jgi:pimeloyl-ACP methyl ester carboxylesterase
LIVQGAEDVSAPPANGHLLQAEIGPRATLIDLPGIGHAVGVEGLDQVARVILRYLSSK